MSIDFNKKNVLVIGGISGIGIGIADSFVNYNANVCITGTRDSINSTQRDITELIQDIKDIVEREND